MVSKTPSAALPPSGVVAGVRCVCSQCAWFDNVISSRLWSSAISPQVRG